MYDYQKSLKSNVSDEIINTYLLRPIAGVIVKVLYRTSITPNQVTIASIVVGVLGGVFYFQGTAPSIALAGILITVKDILDSADGQLARVRNQYTRTGRFLDSIGDFFVDVAIFAAIGWTLYRRLDEPLILLWAAVGFLGITFRVSYHVFYHTSFLHLEEKYLQNRVTEDVLPEDLERDRLALRLQRIFQIIYGWQDRLILRLDEWCRKRNRDEVFLRLWYSDIAALRISGFLGFGTELFLLMLCSVLNELELYLVLNVVVMNGILAAAVVYRRGVLSTLKPVEGNSR